MNNNPLVSIVVITYNSAKYVLETLESAKAQTYPNIELIVSDDCSKDNTYEVCRRWMDENNGSFVSCILTKTPHNMGVSGNLNNAVRHSKGEWIKSLAGDDTLKKNCIERYVSFVQTRKCDFCCCNLDLFSETREVEAKERKTYDFFFQCVRETREQKLKRIIYQYSIPGPGFFYSRKVYDEIGGFDERYPMWEEFPFVYKSLKCGYQIYPLEERLINYRVNDESLCRERNKGLGNKMLFKDVRAIFYKYQLKERLKRGDILNAWHEIVIYETTNCKYRFINNGLIFRLVDLFKILSPIAWYHIVRRIVAKT